MIRIEGRPDEDDFQLALDVVLEASELAKAINLLPKHIGGRVKWTNGVIWTRVNKNGWQPNTLEFIPDERHRIWPSDHIASSSEVMLFDPYPLQDDAGYRYSIPFEGLADRLDPDGKKVHVVEWSDSHPAHIRPRPGYVQEQEDYS